MDICAFRFENGEYFSRLFDFRKISSLLDSLVFLRLVTRLKKRYLIELDIYSRSNFILFFEVPKKEKKRKKKIRELNFALATDLGRM